QNIQPQQVIVIGDTPADVQCARALGAVAVAVRTGYCEPGELEASTPDFLIDNLTQFAQVLSDLGG
ncbi:MAG: HAD family hydrolase, partial [Anaerolineae bacterium]|nr:HAD family hydrolase [Anaerolineae bacterium]